MSARITLHCDTTWRYGTCGAQLMTDAHAACSGLGPQPADAVVAVLHPQGRP